MQTSVPTTAAHGHCCPTCQSVRLEPKLYVFSQHLAVRDQQHVWCRGCKASRRAGLWLCTECTAPLHTCECSRQTQANAEGGPATAAEGHEALFGPQPCPHARALGENAAWQMLQEGPATWCHLGEAYLEAASEYIHVETAKPTF